MALNRLNLRTNRVNSLLNQKIRLETSFFCCIYETFQTLQVQIMAISVTSDPLVGNLTCKPSNGSTELRETRVQAALLSLEIGIVVVIRITSIERSERGKADAFHAAEGNSPEL